MDWFSLIQLGIQYGPQIKNAIDIATSNGDLKSIVTKEIPLVVPFLEQLGAKYFPKVAPELHLVAGAIGAFDANTTKWLQKALNATVTPSPNLEVDGNYGPKTRDAVELFQTQHGLKVDGLAGSVTQAALNLVFAKLPTL